MTLYKDSMNHNSRPLSENFCATFASETSMIALTSPYFTDFETMPRIINLEVGVPAEYFDNANGLTELTITKIIIDTRSVYHFNLTHKPKSWYVYVYDATRSWFPYFL